MKIYQLHSRPSDHDADGENFDEWFTSLKAAKKRRAELIWEAERPDAPPPRYVEDFEIDQHEIAKLPFRQLVIALLTGKGWRRFGASVEVVPPHNIGARRQ